MFSFNPEDDGLKLTDISCLIIYHFNADMGYCNKYHFTTMTFSAEKKEVSSSGLRSIVVLSSETNRNYDNSL